MPTALLSVFDKTGLEDLARGLCDMGYTLLSSGGTATFIRNLGLPVTEVSDYTGFAEMMDGRVKTLHPKIHGGILADRDIPAHLESARANNISMIDLVAVNLYPFTQTLAKPGVERTEIIENIDIGGPSLIRGAAKNHAHVAVLCSPQDYAPVLQELRQSGSVSREKKIELAGKAFAHTAAYDAAISDWFNRDGAFLPEQVQITLPLSLRPRYGENPHQQAAYYRQEDALFTCLHGKDMSYNNLNDADAALRFIATFPERTTVAVFKHSNPCGVGWNEDLTTAWKLAFATDTESPFGGIVVTNRELDVVTAASIDDIFTEIILAPSFAPEALTKLEKKKNRRLVQYDPHKLASLFTKIEYRSCLGGLLAQSPDFVAPYNEDWKVVTQKQPDSEQEDMLNLAWRVVGTLKSNAICLVNKHGLIGMGIGQTSRVASVRIALQNAARFGHDTHGAVCASDGFFPFTDSAELLHEHGITAIVQPGGSKGDGDVIEACNNLGLSMIITGYRHFKH